MEALAVDLRHYLHQARDSLLEALDGLSEYDVRRPVVPSGTNLLGLVKHLAGVEASYLGDCLGRPASLRFPWVDDGSIWDEIARRQQAGTRRRFDSLDGLGDAVVRIGPRIVYSKRAPDSSGPSALVERLRGELDPRGVLI